MKEKMLKIRELLPKVDDLFIYKFFDLESDKMLDEKIEVLTALVNGKKPFEIPKYYDILELYPKDGQLWD
jgi:hypothetical protein